MFSSSIRFICLLGVAASAACSVPAYLPNEARMKFKLSESSGLVYTNYRTDHSSYEPQRVQDGVKIEWGGILQNTSSQPVDIQPSWATAKLGKQKISSDCITRPASKNGIVSLSQGQQADVRCSLVLNPRKYPELLTSDHWIELSIPFLRERDQDAVVFSYKVKIEDFR